jgi:cold shock protein
MSSNEVQRLTGMVKWFNNKSGFGFITVSSAGEYNGKDIFAHYSSIRVTNSQYKYLVQGEYVDFNLSHSENEKHEFHAMDITGVMSGPILCETRRQALSMQTDERRESRPRRTRGPREDTSPDEQVAEA